MSKINCDNNSLSKCSDNFEIYTQEYKKVIDKIFTTMISIPTNSKEWINLDAEKFAEYTKNEKEVYLLFGVELDAFSTFLKSTVERINHNCISILD